MNPNSNLNISIPGIKVNDVSTFLQESSSKRKFDTTEEELKTFLDQADQKGNKDGFISSAELMKLYSDDLPSSLQIDLNRITKEWAKTAGESSATKLKQGLESQEALDSMEVKSFIKGRLADTINNASGKVKLGETEYQFQLFDANDLDQEAGLELKLIDHDGNQIILDQENIPQKFVDTVIAKKPTNPRSVRYSSIFNSRFCSV